MQKFKAFIKRNKQMAFWIGVLLIFPLMSVLTKNLYSTNTVSKLPLLFTLLSGGIALYMSNRHDKVASFVKQNFVAGILLILIFSFPSAFGRGLRFYFDRNGSIYPFLYSFGLSAVFLFPLLMILMKFLSKKWIKIICIGYVVIAATIFTPILWKNTESGWEPLVFYMGLMLYPTRFTFCSFVLVLLFSITINYIPQYKLGKWQIRSKTGKSFLVFLVLVYLTAVTAFPFVLHHYKITFLDNEKKIPLTDLYWGCENLNNADQVKDCVADKLKHYRKRYLYKRRLTAASASNIKEATVTKEDNFISLKDCYSVYKCSENNGKKDAFDKLSVTSLLNHGPSGNTYDPDWRRLVFEIPYQSEYWAAYTDRRPDIILAKVNGKYEAFHIVKNILQLTKDKVLLQIIITRYRETSKKIKSAFSKNDKGFEIIGGYKFYIMGSRDELISKSYKYEESNNLSISLDKRENPKQVFIEIGNNYYSFEI